MFGFHTYTPSFCSRAAARKRRMESCGMKRYTLCSTAGGKGGSAVAGWEAKWFWFVMNPDGDILSIMAVHLTQCDADRWGMALRSDRA